MTIEEMMVILENRVRTLSDARAMAVMSGDLDQVNKIDVDLLTTTSSLDRLRALNSGN